MPKKHPMEMGNYYPLSSGYGYRVVYGRKFEKWVPDEQVAKDLLWQVRAAALNGDLVATKINTIKAADEYMKYRRSIHTSKVRIPVISDRRSGGSRTEIPLQAGHRFR
jgi:hypothetical protein